MCVHVLGAVGCVCEGEKEYVCACVGRWGVCVRERKSMCVCVFGGGGGVCGHVAGLCMCQPGLHRVEGSCTTAAVVQHPEES